MNKVINIGDQDALTLAVGGRLVTYFETPQHVKSAASSAFSDELLKSHIPDKDHFGIHLIAMGSGENYGFNKNGDWWTRDGLANDGGKFGAHTFVSHGHFFREHRNRDPKKAIGSIKAAKMNPDMDRVELVVWGHKKKAEEEYEDAKRGRSRSYSMSARVPYDICSCCQNKAKSSSYYCPCLKNSMTRWMEKFSKFAYAINDQPTFFDISDVVNPADRIAHHLDYILGEEDMRKAASEQFLFSDVLARDAGVILDGSETGCVDCRKQKLLEKLARIEAEIEDTGATRETQEIVKYAAPFVYDPEAISDEDLSVLRKMEPDVLFHHLSKRASVLPFLHFWAYTTGQSIKEASENPGYLYARDQLMGYMFRDILNSPVDGQLESLFDSADAIKAAACSQDMVQQVMNKIEQEHGISQPRIKIRILRIRATPCCKMAANSVNLLSAKEIAYARAQMRAYGLYKIAALLGISRCNGENMVDDPTLILITSTRI